jgi:protein-S-isoprenylcysteine O-methyltransferase Ste14
MEYIILSALWIMYCIIHSALISLRATEFFKRALKERYRYYRLFYNFFSIAALVPVLLYSKSLSDTVVVRWDGYLFVLKILLNTAGIIIVLLAVKEYDILQMIGIRQVMTGMSHRVLNDDAVIKESGILGMVRHPFYSAVFLFLWAHDMTMADIVVNIVLSGYLVIGTMLEEQKLTVEFGSQYSEYKKRVSMFFPFKRMGKAFV